MDPLLRSKKSVPKDSCNLKAASPVKKQPSIEFTTLLRCLQDPNPDASTLEGDALEAFILRYQQDRRFIHPSSDSTNQIVIACFTTLIKQRLCNQSWRDSASTEQMLRLVTCLRILLRDKDLLRRFPTFQAFHDLANVLNRMTELYLQSHDAPFVVDILKHLTSIFQKLASLVEQRDKIVDADTHRSLVLLLSSQDIVVLHCTLYTLISLAQSKTPRALISGLHCIEILLHILQEYDNISKRLASSLLRLLLADPQTRDMVKLYDGVPVLLSLLDSSDSLELVWHVVWCLVQLAEDAEAGHLIRGMGGIPLVLSLLNDRKLISERLSNSDAGSSGNANCEENDDHIQHVYSLKSACCAAITELVTIDANAQQVVVNNGIYQLSVLLLPTEDNTKTKKHSEALATLQRNVFRALRFLFSMERNRRLFKKLFPPGLYEAFIDIGHYVRDINAYRAVVERLNELTREEQGEIRENVEASNQNKEPSQYIRDYAVLEHLGSGAFGSVYKARKRDGAPATFFAIKEVSTVNAVLGRTAKERDKSVGEIISELGIIREQLRHPNVVRYYRTFIDSERLYIVMEMIEGASLAEYFTSLREKGDSFPEERVWHIFVQLVLALRYLHKDKGIVHRDLTPNNIMLGENDKVTITDFGLAKQKTKDCSKMTSVVGTILYACPEIVQNQPYGERADVWSLGCNLYQMCTFQPPFYSSNMLSLATKIVEADYKPIPESTYSEKVRNVVSVCLTPQPEKRPDIVGVASLITDELLRHLDSSRMSHLACERRLERERRRVQRHYLDSTKNMENYHRLFRASQDRYDRLVNLAGSGGASSIKDPDADPEDLGGSQASGSSRPNSGSLPLAQGGVRRRRESSGCENCDRFDVVCEVHGSGVNKDSGVAFDTGACSPSSSQKPPLPLQSPSIVHQRSLSCSSMSQQLAWESGALSPTVQLRLQARGDRSRPDSGGTLTISQRKLREVNDPILRLLVLVHKLVCISQLPPTLTAHPRRRIVERFKRALFSVQISAGDLKDELRKLLIGSRELIDLDLGAEGLLVRQASSEHFAIPANADRTGDLEVEFGEGGITYEQMQTIMEQVLEEVGYYDPERRMRSPTFSASRHTTYNQLASSSAGGSAMGVMRRVNENEQENKK